MRGVAGQRRPEVVREQLEENFQAVCVAKDFAEQARQRRRSLSALPAFSLCVLSRIRRSLARAITWIESTRIARTTQRRLCAHLPPRAFEDQQQQEAAKRKEVAEQRQQQARFIACRAEAPAQPPQWSAQLGRGRMARHIHGMPHTAVVLHAVELHDRHPEEGMLGRTTTLQCSDLISVFCLAVERCLERPPPLPCTALAYNDLG